MNRAKGVKKRKPESALMFGLKHLLEERLLEELLITPLLHDFCLQHGPGSLDVVGMDSVRSYEFFGMIDAFVFIARAYFDLRNSEICKPVV